MFPFLIGTVRTDETDVKKWEADKVSIPHRYGKNWTYEYPYYYELKVFPFLIGTVRTQTEIACEPVAPPRFHSS